ncbi:MAG: aminotransferase class V-fold PLP-dependent enzyme [Christensenellales bacterium]
MIYLDNAATSRFKPRCVAETYVKELSNSSNPGRGGHKDAITAAEKVYNARRLILKYLNADDDYEVIFSSGCTQSINLAILGYLKNFEGQKIDVIATTNEHNATLRTLFYAKNSIHINIIEVKPQFDGSINPLDISHAITADTRLICVCHVSNVTGAVSDITAIGKIAKNNGVAFLVDSAQSLGHINIDVKESNIDFLACAGHKGLHGPQGVGFLVWNTNKKLYPIVFGGTGTDSLDLAQPDTIPEGYEAGTINSTGIIALAAAFKWTMENMRQINLHTRYLTAELVNGLKNNRNVKIYGTPSCGVVSFNYKDYSSTDVGDYLNSCNIAVRSGLHCAPWIHRYLGTEQRGAVRASIGYNNNISDVRALLNALQKLDKINL